ncbi:unnamed protein product [Dicrocoelium dendriticum]|nr:unnamed protein product [Dicrocoelium dendriticum]
MYESTAYRLDCQGPLAQLPADCSPSPRTAARSQCSRFSTTNRFQPLPRLDECTRIESNHALLPAPHRTYPISHYPTEVPFCEACRQQDAELQSAAELKSPSPVGLPSSDDDDASRSWIFKQLPGPWWWCEDCQASVTSPEITIPHLFAVLRQWTPYAQLQLITIVEEVYYITILSTRSGSGSI